MRDDRHDMTEALAVWGRIGCLSFGGPAAQIALMHRVVVDERHWLTERQFLDALAFCMLLPGPEAMQLATYAGWRRHGTIGGLIAGLLFVLPGAVVILTLAAAYLTWGNVPAVQSLFVGIQAAVLVVVLQALVRLSRRSLPGRAHRIVAATAFVALFFLDLPFPLVILAAGLFGLLAGGEPAEVQVPPRASIRATLETAALWLAIWLLPLLLLQGAFREIGLFFAQLAAVTFGGAYAVLAWLAQDAVETRGWLTAAEMLDGLGLAETTPGPLILVTEFVGFLAGARTSDPPSLRGGLLGAVVTLWATFAPCFLWIFAGGPWIDTIAAQPRLRSALAAVSAAVVGVILNLSLWFALHVLFGTVARLRVGPLVLWTPDPASLDPLALGLALMSGLLLLGLGRGVPLTLGVAAALALAADLAV